MRVRLLIALAVMTLVVVVVGLVAALHSDNSDPTHAASTTVDIRALVVGGVKSVDVALPGANAGMARVFIVRETGGDAVAFLGRSTASTKCGIVSRNDPGVSLLTASPSVAFEDLCGGAFYTLDGSCIAGPCHRGLDHYTSRTTGDQLTIDLADLVPGAARA